MNKSSKVRFIGNCWHPKFTHGKVYKIIAGKGDAVPRADGLLGAFIQTNEIFVVRDDHRLLSVKNFLSGEWELVEEAMPTYHPKREYKNPIPDVKSL